MTHSELPTLPPMPSVPPPLPIDSVPLGDAATAAEVKLGLSIAPGPFAPTWASIEANYPGPPDWLRAAKFGIWVHFGPQAAGESGDWYARKMYVDGTPAHRHHAATHGPPSETGYKEILRDWNPSAFDPAALTEIYRDAGAKFLMIQGVHHDNFDLWDSRYHPWNSVRLGPKRDLLAEWQRACRAAGMRFGVTFHHEYTWWWWQNAFGVDSVGPRVGVPYDGHLTPADGRGQWWDGLDPRLLYGVDLREYAGVAAAAVTEWSPPPNGIFTRHADYAKWFATQWALRMMDVADRYDPDFIYTDGTSTQPFSGDGTGTGLKADAMQTVIADFYNRTLARRGRVDTFAVVKFRPKTHGTVNTEEFGIPPDIKTDQPWIAEVPVGDWYYGPGFTYDAGMVIRYVIEAVARDGSACVCVSPRADGSLDDGSRAMLAAVGAWMRRNGEAIYDSRAWQIPGEGEVVDGNLKMLPGGKLDRTHAAFAFGPHDWRFTVGRDGSLYALCMTVPAAGAKLTIRSLGSAENRSGRRPISEVTLLGHDGPAVAWEQSEATLSITCPASMPFETSVVFRIV